MNTKHFLIAALLAGVFAPATARTEAEAHAFRIELAEHGDAADNGGPHEEIVRRFEVRGGGADMHAEHMRFTGPLMVSHGRAVKNAPYSAEMVSEQQHHLADGNQIINKTSTMSYRDSAGRTRVEMRDAGGTVRSIHIHDPVEGINWILRPESKTATKIGPHREMARAAAEKARAAAEKARAKAEEMRREHDASRERIIVKRIERHEGDVAHRIAENVRIKVSKAMEGRMAGLHGLHGLEGLDPMLAGAFGDMKWAGKASTKDLGSREIEGVKAHGKLRSYEIPAGEIGNRDPIVVSTETWYAPDLQVTLLSKRSDPRTGERIHRAANLKREEPAAALFTVPSDYKVKDPMANLRKLEEKK